MKVAVAGGSGFIGRHVVLALVEHGHDVLVLSRHAVARAGVDAHAIDLARGCDPTVLAGCDAVVNLVGIKAPRGANTFVAAHVDALRHLLAAATAAQVRRFVHVSVVRPSAATGPYQATKAEAETLVTSSTLEWTVIRPALVCGPGDDAITRLVQLVRAAPVFPVPAGATGPLQPVDVRDVALAIVHALERPIAIGRTYDVVGPERLDLRTLAHRVGEALALPIVTPPLPRGLMRAAAAVLERMPGDPLVTRSQVGMLVDGLHGDGAPARTDLELVPRPIDTAAIAGWSTRVPSLLPSMRLVVDADHAAWLRGCARALPSLAWFVPLAVALLLVGPWLVTDVWPRMVALEGGLAVVAVLAIALPWRPLLRPRRIHVVTGVAVAVASWALAMAVIAALQRHAPAAIAALPAMRAWANVWPLALAIPMLLVVVAAEEIVWRTAVTLPLAGRLGALQGSIAAGLLFAAAHLTMGQPLLVVAAVLAGTGWSALTIRARSTFATFIAHACWDAALIWGP